MTSLKMQNAQITSTFLGYEDHGILTYYLMLKGDGWGYGFGGLGLDSWNKAKDRRFAENGYGLESIRSILDTVGVQRWEDLTGKYLRCEGEGWGGRILRIGHITDEKWFDPAKLAESFLLNA